jgi:phosphinothricin acetyltransferase
MIIVRPATEADLPAILRIYNDEIATGTATWDEAPWTLEQRRTWFATHDDSQPVLIAETADGEVAGFAYLTLMSSKSGWRFSREDTIYLDPAYRGRGIGRLLLETLLVRARELGLRLIVASITSDNTASITLHRNAGFESMGTMHHAGYKFGKWMDTTYMQLDLGAPTAESKTRN